MKTDQGDGPTSQGMLKITSKAPEASREQNVSSQLEGTDAASA